ncbi:MAG: ATP-binding protein [Nitrospinota bacterium]|nr:ATP-binding protein [Nitrospinota bacterium]
MDHNLSPSLAVRYVQETKISLVIPNDPDLIPIVSSYLSSMIDPNGASCKPAWLELALDEALNNAMYQGNLEMSSMEKTEDFSRFYEIAESKRRAAPYAARRIFVTFCYQGTTLSITVRDEGRGFNWRNHVEKTAEDPERPFGRGLAIIRKYASAMEYNPAGNELTLYFSGCHLAVGAPHNRAQ